MCDVKTSDNCLSCLAAIYFCPRMSKACQSKLRHVFTILGEKIIIIESLMSWHTGVSRSLHPSPLSSWFPNVETLYWYQCKNCHHYRWVLLFLKAVQAPPLAKKTYCQHVKAWTVSCCMQQVWKGNVPPWYWGHCSEFICEIASVCLRMDPAKTGLFLTLGAAKYASSQVTATKT